jgi:hypothetical protein
MTQQLDLFPPPDTDQIWDFFLERGVWLTVGHMEDLEREYPELWEEYLKHLKQTEI